MQTAQRRLDPRHQFPRAERFRDVIIRPDRQADDFIRFLGAGRQQDDIHIRFAAQAGEQFHPIHAGQHQVEHDQIGFVGFGRFQAGRAIGSGKDLVAFGLEIGADKVDNGGFVVDDKDFVMRVL